MKYITARNTSIAISVLSLAVIFVLIVTQNGVMVYDERNFIPNIHLIQQFGLTRKFLLNISGSAGPTYAAIHYLFIGITHLNINYIRLTNFGLLLLLLFFIYLNAKLLKAKDPVIITANFIIIPMVWVSCGLALTEVPAMLFATASLFFLLQSFMVRRKFIIQLLLAILAGLLLSIAILDRSFFLMIAFAIPILVVIQFSLEKFDSSFKQGIEDISFNFPNKNQSLILLAVFLIFSLYLPLKVFMVWGALAPPTDTKLVGANDLSIVPWYGVLSFCYCGFITLILAPNWFIINKKILITTLAISFFFMIANVYNGYFEFAPFLTAAIKFLSPGGFIIYQRVIPAFIFLFSFHFVLSSLIRLWENRHNPIFAFLALVILLIAFSTIKVKAQFSSRYVAQITPFFLLIFIRFERTDWQKVIRAGIGAGLGFVSLYFYFHGV
jgi:hypothetical protein